MVQTVLGRETQPDLAADSAEFIKAFQHMVRARVLDEKFASLYRAGKIHGGVFLGRGQEALSAALGQSLQQGDVFAPLIRDAAGRLAFGEPLLDAVRTYLGSVLGPMRGRDGNVHRGRPREGLLPMISHLGAMISVVNGTLMAHRFRGISGTVGVTCLGDGGTSTGAFHEALNQAAVERLPLVLVVANNQYAYSTSTSKQFACHNLVDRAVGYGIRGYTVDGTDLHACLAVVGKAVRLARDGDGPQFIVAELLRLCGHGEHDDFQYLDPELTGSSLGRDCLDVAEGFLATHKLADRATLEAWKQQAVREVEETVAKVQREPAPDPYREGWCALASKHLSEMHNEI